MDALIYFNSKELIHLDLKPKNIMFKTKELNEIVLVDFGISKVFKHSKSTLMIAYTPDYIAPELKTSLKVTINSSAADIFSFGLYLFFSLFNYRICYEILTNTHPIYEEKVNFFKNNKNKSTGMTKIDHLICNCLNFDPNKRPSAVELKETIEKIKF